jgi:hypothetical protein
MYSKRTAICLSMLIGLALCALAGCAQFQDSFGEITDPDHSLREYARTDSETTLQEQKPDGESVSRNSSAPRSQRNLIFEGVKVELSNGELLE